MKKNSYYLNALVNGRSKVIEEIYKKLFPLVKKFVVQNRGSAEDAEDVFQKGLLQLVVRFKKERFEIKSSFDAYFFTVCKNLWRRELNKAKNKVTNNTLTELISEEQDISLAILEQERWELFNEKLERMSDNCKKILKLFFNKVAYVEIVEKMNYNSETVARQRVFKCKNRLKELISEDGRLTVLREL